MVKAAWLSGSTPDAFTKVIVKVHGVVAGTGNWPCSGTWGPTAVASTCPRASWTRTESPSIASHGCAALAGTTRPTDTVGVGSQLGRPPYRAGWLRGSTRYTLAATATATRPARISRRTLEP